MLVEQVSGNDPQLRLGSIEESPVRTNWPTVAENPERNELKGCSGG